MKPNGKQVLIEFISCSEKFLNDKSKLEDILKIAIKKSKLSLVSIRSHKFNPIGITSVAIINQSHVILHTYPEAKHVSIDIFTCSPDNKSTNDLINFLRYKLKPKIVKFTEILRGDVLDVNRSNWLTSSSETDFEIRYYIKKKLFSKKSKYQQIDIIDNDSFGRMLFLDNDLQIAEKDADIYNLCMVKPIINRKLGSVAILGGGDGGILKEVLKYNPDSVTLVDIDKEVINVSQKYLHSICESAFKNSKVKIIIDNVYNFLDKSNNFDTITYDLTMHPETFTKIKREIFLNKLFLKINKSLNKNGVISLQCCSELDKETFNIIKRILMQHFSNIRFTKEFIPSFCQNWIFASGIKK